MKHEAVIKKLRSVEQAVATEKGDLVFFAFLLREDSPDRWDLVVAAPWIGEKKGDALQYLVSKLKQRLKPSELIILSRVVILDPSDAPAQAITRSLRVEDKAIAEVENFNLSGLEIAEGIILRSKPAVAPAA